MTTRLTNPPFDPVGTAQAVKIGLVDAVLGATLREFRTAVRAFAQRIAQDGLHRARLQDKRRRRAQHEHVKPLHAYRTEELAKCLECFFGPDPSYHQARKRFVYKTPTPHTNLRQAA
jgi:putative two-component system hydrogenase maturation factor HypX/HoxX